jgi:uncharacterized protein (DUF58 family)
MDVGELSKRARRVIFPSSRFAAGVFAGAYRSVFRGPGLEFEEVRHYLQGDDIRTVDWNVSARLGSLFTKRFQEERELPVFILFDISASMDYSSAGMTKRECAAFSAALFAYAAVHSNDKAGAVLFSDSIDKWIKPARGTRHAARMVSDFLTCRRQGGGSNLNEAMKTVYTSAVKRGICILVSDFKTEIDTQLVGALSKKHDLLFVQVLDPAEREFPKVGYIEMVDAESGRSYGLKSLGNTAGAEIAGGLASASEDVKRLGRRTGTRRRIEAVELSTDSDPYAELLRFFKRKMRHS